MKVGLISDIHADVKSLRIALDILQGQQVDRVICCGDLVDKGLDGDAVVSLIQERKIPSVMGNHDQMAFHDQQWIRRHYGSTHPMLLKDETLDYLDQLLPELPFFWEGCTVLLAHGTPRSNNEYLFPYSSRNLFEAAAKSYPCDVMLLGHTHEPMMVSIRDTWIFNPGSVCHEQAEGSGTCATLNLPDLTFRVFDVRSGKRVQPAYINFDDKRSGKHG